MFDPTVIMYLQRVTNRTHTCCFLSSPESLDCCGGGGVADGIAISFWTFVCVFESRTSVHNLIKTNSMKTSITYTGRHFRTLAKESQSPDYIIRLWKNF